VRTILSKHTVQFGNSVLPDGGKPAP